MQKKRLHMTRDEQNRHGENIAGVAVGGRNKLALKHVRGTANVNERACAAGNQFNDIHQTEHMANLMTGGGKPIQQATDLVDGEAITGQRRMGGAGAGRYKREGRRKR